eukprot:SM000414S15655  [mRNA]  locus=s414:3839:5748:- [translate_table: standard]
MAAPPPGLRRIRFRAGAVPGVAVVTLDRPAKKNAIDAATYSELVAALAAAAADPALHALILTGAGDYFSSGADLSHGRPFQGDPVEAPVGQFMLAVMRFPKLLVAAGAASPFPPPRQAAGPRSGPQRLCYDETTQHPRVLPCAHTVNGPAVGIGTTVLFHCDFVFASSTATFWTPFVHVGVVPEFCSSLLFPQVLGPALASQMLMASAKIDAQTALSKGLVAAIYPPEDVVAEAEKRVDEMLRQPLASEALPVFKRLLRQPQRQHLEAVFMDEMAELYKRFSRGDFERARKYAKLYCSTDAWAGEIAPEAYFINLARGLSRSIMQVAAPEHALERSTN